jgi:hypothetical protein
MGKCMDKQQEVTWRELLGQMLESVRERQRLAAAVCVNVATLQRWARDRTMPREEHMQQLLQALPADIYPTFLRLLAVDFPDLLSENGAYERSEQPGPEVPSEFYRRILDVFTFTPWPMCRMAIQDLILQQIIELLDPERHGLAISIIRCMPPRRGGKVLSLREIGGIGTHPWKRDLEQKMFFFGAESLVGHAITHLTASVVNSRHELTFYPAHWTEYENSAAAFPILCHAKVAGGLVASCAREGLFTAGPTAILEYYADLASLLFEPEDFYSNEEISLRLMPLYSRQTPFFHNFNQRVSRKFSEALLEGRQIALQEARLAVWQDLEAELLEAHWHPEEPD